MKWDVEATKSELARFGVVSLVHMHNTIVDRLQGEIERQHVELSLYALGAEIDAECDIIEDEILEEKLEKAYQQYIVRRNSNSEWQTRYENERDAFKTEVRALCSQLIVQHEKNELDREHQ